MTQPIVGLRGSLGNLISSDYGTIHVINGGTTSFNHYPLTWPAKTASWFCNTYNPGIWLVVAWINGVGKNYMRGDPPSQDFTLDPTTTTLAYFYGDATLDAHILPMPVVFWDDEFRELQGFTPVVKVYQVTSTATMKGFGYGWRKIKTQLTIDIKCRDNAKAQLAKEEIARVLGDKRKGPFADCDVMEYTQGTQKAGYSGFYWWIIEVISWQIRKPVAI